MRKSTNRAALFFSICVLLVSLSCSVNATGTQESFIESIETAIAERQEAITQYPSVDTMSVEEIKEAYGKWVVPEYDAIQKYKDVEFENSKFNQLVRMYMNGVEDQVMAVEYLPNYPELFNLVWSAGYNQRVTSIVAFVDYYDLQLDESTYLEFVNAMNSLNQPQYTATIGDAENNEDPAISGETEEEPIGHIEELFADKAIAEFVREKLGKIDISQEVTQGELNSITELRIYSANDYGAVEKLDGIANLQKLEYLGLYNRSAAELTILPDELFTLSNLKELDVNQSKIEKLPEEVGELSNLETLNVGWTGVSYLPVQICDLENLKSLIFAYTPVTEIPENIGNLKNLQRLEMFNTEVSALPDSIGECTALKVLKISDTKITQLPESLYNLNLDTFETKGLHLSNSGDNEDSGNETNGEENSASPQKDSVSIEFYSSVNNDTTGKWRLAITSTDYPVSSYLKSYYNNYFGSDDEIHAIINTNDLTTTCVAVRAGHLNVTVHKYLSGEEKDANLLFGGDVISDKWYDKETWKEVDF